MQPAVGEPRGADGRERRVSAILRQIHQGRSARNRQCRRPGTAVKSRSHSPATRLVVAMMVSEADRTRTISDVEPNRDSRRFRSLRPSTGWFRSVGASVEVAGVSKLTPLTPPSIWKDSAVVGDA